MKKDGMRPIFIYRHHEVIPSFDIRLDIGHSAVRISFII
jgi:hypothetical protein